MDPVDVRSEIIKTKLYPPRLPAIVPREKLVTGLRGAAQARLTIIVAGAGYGKSTLAAEFLAAEEAPYVWYQLDEADRDLSVFVTYLVSGIRMLIDDFGVKTLERLAQSGQAGLDCGFVLKALLVELGEHLSEDMYIVLDDFQMVNGSSSVTGALDFLVSRVPPNLHFMVLSRVKPDLDVHELRARRHLVELDEADLRFSPRETSALFSDVFGLPVIGEHAEALYRFTEGWVSGLVLIYLALKEKGGEVVEETVRHLDLPPSKLYGYLSNTVYQGQSGEVRDFLVRTSILSRINPGFCDELLGIEGSAAILSYLTDARLFTIPLDGRGEWYRYHHLLRSMLSDMLDGEYSPDEKAKLNARAAVLWEMRGEPEQALTHHMAAGDHGRAADILSTMAPELMKSSRAVFLQEYLEMLPEETLEEHPWLVFSLARISDFMGEYEEGIQRYHAAAALFESKSDRENQARSLVKEGWMLAYIGKPDEASACLARATEVLPHASQARQKVMAVLSTESALRGLYDASRRFESEVLARLDEVEGEITKANMLYWCALARLHRGAFSRASLLFSRALEIAERERLYNLMPAIYMFLSSISVSNGDFDGGLALAENALRLGEEQALGPVLLIGRTGRALALAHLGGHAKALKDVEVTIEICRELGAGLEASQVETVAGIVCLVCGERRSAMEHFRNGLAVSERNGYRSGVFWCRLGIVAIAMGERDLEKDIEEVASIIEACGGEAAEAFTVPGHLILTALHARKGAMPEARKALKDAIGITESEGGIAWWKMVLSNPENNDLLAPLIAEIFSRGEHLDTLGFAFRCIGVPSLLLLKGMRSSDNSEVRKRSRELAEAVRMDAIEPLEIRMLGTFEVKRGGEVLTAEDWRSGKALTVLKYLASQKDGGPVPRDVLMELLWPESTPEAAAKSLGTALSALRKTLEPEAPRGVSSYLVSSGESLRLEVGRDGWVDSWRFVEKIKEAEEARRSGEHDLFLEALLDAVKTYRGDLLQENLYDDWCMPERERLRREYVEALSNIAGEYSRREKYTEALEYLEKAIAADPGREASCRSEMEIWFKMGDRSGVERAFMRCRDYLSENFDVSPSSETTELYQKLRGKKE